jgi:hypothetical protein
VDGPAPPGGLRAGEALLTPTAEQVIAQLERVGAPIETARDLFARLWVFSWPDAATDTGAIVVPAERVAALAEAGLWADVLEHVRSLDPDRADETDQRVDAQRILGRLLTNRQRVIVAAVLPGVRRVRAPKAARRLMAAPAASVTVVSHEDLLARLRRRGMRAEEAEQVAHLMGAFPVGGTIYWTDRTLSEVAALVAANRLSRHFLDRLHEYVDTFQVQGLDEVIGTSRVSVAAELAEELAQARRLVAEAVQDTMFRADDVDDRIGLDRLIAEMAHGDRLAVQEAVRAAPFLTMLDRDTVALVDPAWAVHPAIGLPFDAGHRGLPIRGPDGVLWVGNHPAGGDAPVTDGLVLLARMLAQWVDGEPSTGRLLRGLAMGWQNARLVGLQDGVWHFWAELPGLSPGPLAASPVSPQGRWELVVAPVGEGPQGRADQWELVNLYPAGGVRDRQGREVEALAPPAG